MSGISGFFSTQYNHDAAAVIVSKMLRAQRHRGPDGRQTATIGPCTVGHARLAVIDTSPDGVQPLTIKGVTLVFDGELYSFREQREFLASRGVSFSGTSDAEVLLRLYLHYGQDFLQYLQGTYAFALWDDSRRLLLCARDPFGTKPFLYTMRPEGFMFASELKGLLASGLLPREADRQSLRCLLERGSVSQPASIVREVQWLLPGHVLTIGCDSPLRVHRFSSFSDKPRAVPATPEELAAEGETILVKSLERRMISSVPLGAFLSGGIDSSLLVALMTRLSTDVRTFSVGFEDGLTTDAENETDDALEVAQHLQVEHMKIVVRQKDVIDSIRAVAAGLDHPTVDGVNTWFIAQATRQYLTVAISGTGGDELFAGYPWFAAMREWSAAPWIKKIVRASCGESFPTAFDRQYRIFPETQAARLCPGTSSLSGRPDPLHSAESLNRVTGMVLSGYTRDQLLADIDTASMWHGLEIRAPFLDEEVLAFALSLPPEMKIGASDRTAPASSYAATGVKKILFDIAAPLLPNGFANRAKRGFTLPLDGWLHGVLAPCLADMLSVPTVRRRGFFDPQAVAAVHKAFTEKRCSWVYPWLLMMTELWAQEVLDV